MGLDRICTLRFPELAGEVPHDLLIRNYQEDPRPDGTIGIWEQQEPFSSNRPIFISTLEQLIAAAAVKPYEVGSIASWGPNQFSLAGVDELALLERLWPNRDTH